MLQESKKTTTSNQPVVLLVLLVGASSVQGRVNRKLNDTFPVPTSTCLLARCAQGSRLYVDIDVKSVLVMSNAALFFLSLHAFLNNYYLNLHWSSFLL